MCMKLVVKKEEALKKVFKGVSLDSLAVGEKSQVTKMNYVSGNYASPTSILMSKVDMLCQEDMSFLLVTKSTNLVREILIRFREIRSMHLRSSMAAKSSMCSLRPEKTTFR